MLRFSIIRLALFCLIITVFYTTFLILRCSNDNAEIEAYKRLIEKDIQNQKNDMKNSNKDNKY